MNIEKSFMDNHVFTKKTNDQYNGSDTLYDNNIQTGGIPLSKLLSNINIKAISHLGIPCGLVSCNKQSHKTMTGGNNTAIKMKNKNKDASMHDSALANKLFSLITTK
jgi:hypothetical protein